MNTNKLLAVLFFTLSIFISCSHKDKKGFSKEKDSNNKYTSQIMKQTLIALLMLLLLWPTYGQRIELLKEENGFREFTFDTKKTDYDNIYARTDAESKQVYYVVSDDLYLFNLNVYEVRIYFSEEKLSSINLYFVDHPERAYEYIKEELEKKYGPSREMSPKLGFTELDWWEYEYSLLHLYYMKDSYVNIRYSVSFMREDN